MAALPRVNQRVIPLIFAIAMGLVAVVGVHQYIRRKEHALAQERAKLLATYREPISVVMAAQDFPEGTALEAPLLTTASIPQSFVQPYAVSSPNEVAGMITLVPIAEGEQVLTTKLRRPDVAPPGSTLSLVMPEGKRAATIQVDALTGVGGFVRPGDKIDVLWTIALPSPSGGQGEPVTLTLFQDVPVVAVGPEFVGRQPVQGEEAQTASSAAGIVTLAMTPQDISFLLFAREHGRIQLSLRPRNEGGVVAVAPANLNTLIEAVLGVSPTRPEPTETAREREVEVYKGLKRDVLVLSEKKDD